MTKIVVPDIDSGYNLTQINVALQALATELNDKVLYRDNPTGEPNSMDNNLDMNSFQILNLPAPATQNSPARLRDVQSAIVGLAPASLVPFTPVGTIGATTVQAAIEEVNTEGRAYTDTLRSDLASTASGKGAALIGVRLDAAGAADRTQHQKNAERISALDFAGYDPTGAISSVAALLAADAAARAAGKALWITGTPLVDSTITLNAKTHWIFEGASGAAQGDVPFSYLRKAASLNGPAIVIRGDGTKFEGGGIVGDVGNGGDGIRVLANSFSWVGAPYIYRMGRDGMRIGWDADPRDRFANSFYIEHLKSCANGRYGVNLNDAPGQYPNANAGMLVAPFLHHNASHGLYINNANLGNVIICPLLEANTGAGLFFDTEANRNVIIGGDIEANDGGAIINNAAIRLGNRLENVSVEGVVVSTSSLNDFWTPELFGGTVAGSGTYTSRKAHYTLTGGVLVFVAEIVVASHSGTGQININLPDLTGQPINAVIGANFPAFVPVSVITSGISIGAGASSFGLVRSDTLPPRLQLYTSSAGVVSSLPVPSTFPFTLYINGSVAVANL